MTLTEADYWRDAIAMAIADGIDQQTVWEAVLLSERGEQFNAAIWASGKLQDITECQGQT